MKEVLLVIMIFCHIVDDYYLQGCLANMKQKKWWKQNAPQELYKYDYIVALIAHSFSWAFMILLPLMIYMFVNNCFSISFYITSLIINIIIHAVTDNLKANKLTINLIIDQSIHLIQILISYFIFYIL